MVSAASPTALLLYNGMGDVTSGEISDVFDNKDARDPWLYIAILADQADEYIPASDPVVKDELTNMIKRRKAGDAMVKQYSGKGNLNATAQAMGVVPANVADMRFGGAAMLRDLVVSARIMGTAPGSKVHVAKGDNGVYAYEVVSKNANNTPADKAQQNMIYNAIFGGFDNPNPQNPLPYGAIGKLLRGNMQIENNRYELMGSN